VCLWGNSTDLSLLIDMTEEDIKKLQSTGGDALAATEKNILGNDLHALADYVTKIRGGRIDFVLDNAGFELYCDLVYADWLIQSGICDKVIFHGKKLPWFVSDVTKKDWDWLLNTCTYGQLFQDASDAEMDSLRTLGRRWKQYEKEGKWKYEAHPFWCTGYTFVRARAGSLGSLHCTPLHSHSHCTPTALPAFLCTPLHSPTLSLPLHSHCTLLAPSLLVHNRCNSCAQFEPH
jgi:hypothetical protein